MNSSPFMVMRYRSLHHVFGQESCCAIGLVLCVISTGGTALAQVAVPPPGIINTIAGTVDGSDLGDGSPALSAALSNPYGTAVDRSGNVYIADMSNNRVRVVSASTGIITNLAGDPDGEMGYSGDSGPAANARLNGPTGVAIDAIGNIYIADNGNSVVRMVTASTGVITTIAGNGNYGYSGDGGAATNAQLFWPNAVTLDASGNLYIADTYNNVIRLVTAETGIITTIAGNGSSGGAYGGDGGLATSAQLSYPNGVALDSNNNLYIADTNNNVVRKVAAATGIITTVAGNGTNAGNPFGGGYTGDGGPATSATMAGPFGVAVDGAGHLYIADCYNQVVRMVSPDGTIATVAGNGSPDYGGDGGQATDASMHYPVAVALDTAGNLYVVDTWNSLTRAVGLPWTHVQNHAPIPPQIQDRGIVTLAINGVVAASTTYGLGEAPSTLAWGLSQGLVSGAPVSLTVQDGQLAITAKTTGPDTNYSYSIQNTQYDSADFSAPSFPAATITGSLSGGAAAGGPAQRPVYLFLGDYDSAGNLTGYRDSVMGHWSFSYDALNRLQGAQNISTTTTSQQYADEYGCWSYDDFGNRLSQGISTAPCWSTPTLTSWATYNANNQFVTTNSMQGGGVGYDAAGGVTNDGINTSLYDAEGRVCAIRSSFGGTKTGYLYDAVGTRIAKGTISQWSCDPSVNGFQVTTDYVLGLGGEQVTEMQGGVWQHTNVFAGRTLLATYDQQGLHFHLSDPLGTRRAQTDYAGNLEQTCTSLPFGDDFGCSRSNTNPTEQHFTGKERDAESGNDYFDARYYNSATGRFMSPDWSASPNPVPYASLTNPQTLNLYAFVRNSPLSYVYIDGHDGCQIEGVDANCAGISNEAAVQCPNNNCNPVNYNNSGQFYQFVAGAGGAQGYVPFSDPTGSFNELNGQFVNDQVWHDQVIQPYIDAMTGKLGTAVGAPLSGCDSVLHGGNLNCTISAAGRDSYVQTHDCLTGGGEYRCAGPGYSLHFHPPDASGQLTFHMDSANAGFLNPWSVQFPGVVEHFFIDVFGGHTIFDSGVPH